MSVKTKLARKAVKTTAKHTAHGTASKFTRKPLRSITLLAAGAAIGVLVSRLIGRKGGDDHPDPIAPAPASPDAATNKSTEKSSETGVTTLNAAPEPDEEFVADEEAEAAKEAAGIGGTVAKDTDDPAQQPVIEGGEGEAEGFELAEKDLQDIAEHGDQHRFPGGMAQPEEPQDPDVFGEPDEALPPDENS
jgi:hypothetical protein